MATFKTPASYGGGTGKRQRRIKLSSLEGKSELQEIWEARILRAERVKAGWREDFATQTLQSLYEGRQMPDFWKNEKSWFTINLIFSAFRVLKRNVVPKNVRVNVRLARSYRADPQAVQQFQAQSSLRSAVLEYFINQLKVCDEMALAYLNCLWEFGALKVGYACEMEDNPNYGYLSEDKEGNLLYLPNGENVREPKKNVVKEEFFIDSVDSECILVDPDCRNMVDKTARWIAHKIFKPVAEVKADSLYKNTSKLQPTELEKEEELYLYKNQENYRTPLGIGRISKSDLEEDQMAVLYEIYDLRRGEVLTIARGHSEPIRKPEPIAKGIDLHPFIFLKFFERRNSFYPIPISYNWVGPQMEYNLRRNMMALHLKRYTRRYIYNGIEPEQIEKLESGEDGVHVEVGQNARIEPVRDAPLDQAHYFDTTTLRKEFDDMSGVGELARARMDAESATEAEITENRSREGEVDEHEIVMHAFTEVARKLHKCIEANITQEGAISIIGPAGTDWVYFGPENFDPIEGEFLFDVTAEEAQRETLMVERSQLLQFLDLLAKNPILALSPTLLRATMQKFPTLANNELLLQEIHMIAVFQMQMQAQQQAQATEQGEQDRAMKQKQHQDNLGVKKEGQQMQREQHRDKMSQEKGRIASKSRKVTAK